MKSLLVFLAILVATPALAGPTAPALAVAHGSINGNLQITQRHKSNQVIRVGVSGRRVSGGQTGKHSISVDPTDANRNGRRVHTPVTIVRERAGSHTGGYVGLGIKFKR
jgi:hypothetical protein